MYKVGDRVRVISVDSYDVSKGIEVGDELKVSSVYSDGYVTVKKCNFVLYTNQIEKVEEDKEMTFPEMVQKLIDGEFKVGMELVMTDEDGLKVTFYVRKNMYGYGISKEADWFVENKVTFPSVLNGTWSVKEDIKEMSIEELQKELGYKIKIVE